MNYKVKPEITIGKTILWGLLIGLALIGMFYVLFQMGV